MTSLLVTPTLPIYCTAYGPGLEPVVQDLELTYFLIEARDTFGKLQNSSTDAFTVALSSQWPATVALSAIPGVYNVTYVPEKEQVVQIDVSLAGIAIRGSPFVITVVGGTKKRMSKL